MKINVKLVAHSGAAVAGIGADGKGELTFPEGVTVADVLGSLDVAREKLTMALVNDAVVRPSDQGQHVLQDGDSLTVFPPIEGG